MLSWLYSICQDLPKQLGRIKTAHVSFIHMIQHFTVYSNLDMEFLEVLTEGLERVLMVRGGGREVITIYS